MNRIEKAIDIFLDAINNGTLAKGHCTTCAVGNLVREGMKKLGIEYSMNTLRINSNWEYINWSLLFATTGGVQDSCGNEEFLLSKHPIIRKQIESTDFTIDELAAIEFAFETNTRIISTDYQMRSKKDIRNDQIKGLAAVVKVMQGFTEGKEDYVEQFVEKAELITL